MSRRRNRRQDRTGDPYNWSSDVESLPRPYGPLGLSRAEELALDDFVEGVRRGDGGRAPMSAHSVARSIYYGGAARHPLAKPILKFGWRSPVGLSRAFGIPIGLHLRSPLKVRFCVSRGTRREVLFAKRVAGRRGGSPGPYRRSQNSQYSCG